MTIIFRRGRTKEVCPLPVIQNYKSFFFVSLFLLLASLATATPDNIEIISSTNTELSFRLTSLSDSRQLIQSVAKDSSIVNHRSVQIAVPVNAYVSIISANGSSPKLYSSGETSLQTSSLSIPLAKLSEPTAIRGNRFVTLSVFPVHGSQVYDEVEIRLLFQGGDLSSAASQPADPHFDKLFKRSVINFDQMKSWPTARTFAKPTAQQAGIGQATTWLKLFVTEAGLYSLSGSELQAAGISIANLVSDSIRIFNGGGLPLEIANELDRPSLSEIAIMVADGGDGQFDTNDRLYFYGEAVDRWIYPQVGFARFLNNVYTTENVYWLAVEGNFSSAALRVFNVAAIPDGSEETTVVEFLHRQHVEKDSLLLRDSQGHIDDYYRWFWTDSEQHSFFAPAPGIVSGSTATVLLSGRTGGLIRASFNAVPGTANYCNRFSCEYITTSLIDGLNSVSLELSRDGSSTPGFDYLDLTYRRLLRPEENSLGFVLENISGSFKAEVTDNFTGTPVILDVTKPKQIRLLTGQQSDGKLSFATTLSGRWGNYLVTQLADAQAPDRVELVQPTDLSLALQQKDFLIVTPRQFVSSMAEYVALREASGYSIKVVAVEDIMDNFSFGVYDPTAIRDYLKYAYENYASPAPAIVLFVGDANNDFCDVQQTGVTNLVPAYIHSLPSQDESYSDDNYVYFDKYGILDADTSYGRLADRGVDMMAARWPISSVDEIGIIVGKIKNYESAGNLGFWRSRITLVADDEFGGLFDNETFHTKDAERLDTLIIPVPYNRDKIYMVDHQLVNSTKPTVNDAIVKSFNDGSLIVNYIGHGNPDVWAHEHVFQRTSDLPRLSNFDRLPLMFAASCAIAFFDDPKREGMAEDFLAMSNGGAIAVIAATRLVYAGDNAVFNRAVFDILFNEPELTMCEAMYAGKLRRQYLNDSTMFAVSNDRAYAFFGDPCLHLGLPEYDIVFDEQPDSLTALLQEHVVGHIVDENGQPMSVAGELSVNLYDSDQEMTYRLSDGSDIKVDYSLPGSALFRGRATVTNGSFSFDFVTPLDVGFGGQEAKLIVYAVLDSAAAIGAVGSLAISDQVTVSTDTVGPIIEFGFTGRESFVSGDRITLGDQLELTIIDSSGINLSGGLGHGIVLEIDQDPSATVVLNDLFEADRDDFRTGQLTLPLTDIGPGLHSFKIRAWDNANNSSSVEFSAEVVASGPFAIEELLNYPNPMQVSTTFYFALSQSVERFALEIFTLSGKKIKSYNQNGLAADNYPNSSFSLTWDGRDADGDRVATGVYIYKAIAQSFTTGETAESFGKIVLIN